MTNTNIKISNFDFRTKFRKLLTEEELPMVHKAFEKFCNLPKGDARKQLWLLTYAPSTVIAELGLAGIILTEKAEPLRNELRHQYEKLISSLFEIEDKATDVKGSLDRLNDPVMAYIIYSHCAKSAVEDDETSKNRILFLLASEDEKQFFGGIRSLRFTKEEAKFLKKFNKEIYKICKSIYENCEVLPKAELQNTEEILAEPTSSEAIDQSIPNEPSAEVTPSVLEDEDTSCEVLPANKLQDTEEIPVEPKHKALTPKNVLSDITPFTLYVIGNDANILSKIGSLGYDLSEVAPKALSELENLGYDYNEIVAKSKKIKKFLLACAKLRGL